MLVVCVAHSGKTLELDCTSSASVGAVQEALASLTGISLADQILMCDGARLEGDKALAAYGLPGAGEGGAARDVFLFHRGHLRPGAPLPPLETLPDFDAQALAEHPEAGEEAGGRHALDAAASPLLRALPEYQRQFAEHLRRAAHCLEASQQRLAACDRLVAEQEVQAACIDAATSNVEVHYAYIAQRHEEFRARYDAQHAAHGEVLSRVDADLAFLAATELHPAAQSRTARRLIDLLDSERMGELAASASKSHHHFAAKVGELESVFGLLRSDVEALFMAGPSVDLPALGQALEEAHGLGEELGATVQALAADLGKVRHHVAAAAAEHAQRAAGAAASSAGGSPRGTGGASALLPDVCHMLETMHGSHEGHLLPRALECHAALATFAERCLECKNSLTRDVLGQLQMIASQQSRIRSARDQLALFGTALERQEAAVEALLAGRRLAAAYKACLAECVRRGAFGERYAHSAARLAEGMGRFREKELATRASFRQHVERHIPTAVLERLGLLEAPALCQVSVAGGEEALLPRVGMDEVRRLLLPWASGSSSSLLGGSTAAAAARPDAGSGEAPSALPPQEHGGEEEGNEAEGGPGFEDALATLRMENARLRAELASQIALDCLRLEREPAASAAASAGASSGSAPAEASGSGAAAGASSQASAAKFERALAAKDGLVQELGGAVGAAQALAATYAARIAALEAQLRHAAAETRAGAGRGSGGAAAAAEEQLATAAVAGGAITQEATASPQAAGSLPAPGPSSEVICPVPEQQASLEEPSVETGSPLLSFGGQPAPGAESGAAARGGGAEAPEALGSAPAEQLAGSAGALSSVEGIEPVSDSDASEDGTV